MGLLFGSAGAHTYLKSGKVPPFPPRGSGSRSDRDIADPCSEDDNHSTFSLEKAKEKLFSLPQSNETSKHSEAEEEKCFGEAVKVI